MSLSDLKSFWFFLSPGNLLLAGTLLALCLVVLSKRRTAFVILALVAAAEFSLTALPIGDAMLASLEARFPSPAALPENVAGILVLGGAELPDETTLRGQPALNKSAERLTMFFSLMQRFPAARAVFAGGPPVGGNADQADAVTARLLLSQMGADMTRIAFDDRSNNTYEALENGLVLAAPSPGETWLLITSAWNMPRAMEVAYRLCWKPVPVPVDFRATLPLRAPEQFAVALTGFELAVKEWISLIVYGYLGRTSDAPLEPPRSASVGTSAGTRCNGMG